MNEIDQVIAEDMCVGCGACVFARPDLYAIEMTPAGHWKANRKVETDEDRDTLSRICPMSGVGRNETEIAAALYPALPANDQIGRYLSTFAAHVDEDEFRARGGSGGLVSWILAELFRRDEIDAVLHVKPVNPEENDGLLFRYAISQSEQEMIGGAKSRYYPIEMSSILEKLKGSSKRYAVVGLPCFIKAVRHLQDEGLLSREQIPFCLGLICGHLKSRYFADYLAQQKGEHSGRLAAFDFRRKLENHKASDYGFAYRLRSCAEDPFPAEAVWPMSSVRGRDWGEGMFKNTACEFCDDVIAECADVAIGDAWLPDYVGDYRGTNVVVTRHEMIEKIIREGAARGAVTLGPANVAAVIRSQSSGLRHRREGLAHRLARRVSQHAWVPAKRVRPALAAGQYRKKIYDARLEIAATSAALYGEGQRSGQSLAEFERQIAPALARYGQASLCEKRSGVRGLARGIFSRLKRLLRG